MDKAVGSKIADYIIKPVNPTQILLTLKKNIHKKEIVTEVAQNAYQQNFGKIGMQINDSLTFEDWKEVYKRLVYWELELSETDSNMDEMLGMQKTEANLAFAKFIHKHYEEWITHPEDRPLMSPDIFKTKIFPLLNQGEKVFLIVLDNFRYDQWRTLSTELAGAFLLRMVDDVVRRALLDDDAAVHEDDPVGHVAQEKQILHHQDGLRGQEVRERHLALHVTGQFGHDDDFFLFVARELRLHFKRTDAVHFIAEKVYPVRPFRGE